MYFLREPDISECFAQYIRETFFLKNQKLRKHCIQQTQI